MYKMSCFRRLSGIVFTGLLICFLVPLTSSGRLARILPLAFQETTEPPGILWGQPVNGLAVGMFPPEFPWQFILSPDALAGTTSPLAVTNSGLKPGGQWDRGARLDVYLKNTGGQPLYWSNSPEAWTFSIAGRAFSPFDVSKLGIPAADHGVPLLLGPGKLVRLTLPVTEALWLWPAMKEGQYRIAVAYDSRTLLSTNLPVLTAVKPGFTDPSKTNTEPQQPVSFRVPGFWVGRASTPNLNVNIQAIVPELDTSAKSPQPVFPQR